MLRMTLLGFSLLAASVATSQEYFGYTGVICGLDGPGEDFAAEVAPFTNIAHICPTGDGATDAANLAHAYALGMTPLYHAEPIFFERGISSMWRRDDNTLWQQTRRSVEQSGVPASEIIFYIADQPSLFRVWPHDLEPILRRIQTDLPGARTMVIDALREHHPALIPRRVDFWGFTNTLVGDPESDEDFMRRWDIVVQSAPPGVQLVLIMDASFTPAHAEAGLVPDDMAEVAARFADLARTTPRTAILLAYAWPGGVGSAESIGTRELPAAVRRTHEEIGRAITGRN